MADLVSEKGEFSCNFCTSKLSLGITSSSTCGQSKKLANRSNSFFAPPGGNCSFPPGVPPSPCPGVPPGCVIATGQTIVSIDGQTALGDGCKFLCPKMQPVLLSKAGQTVGKHNEASGNVAAMIIGGVLIVAGVALLICLLPAETVAAAVAGVALAARVVGRVAIALLAKAVKMAINALKKKPSAKPQPKPQPQIQAKSQPKQVTQQPKQQPAANDPVHGGTKTPQKTPQQSNQQPAANDPNYGYRGPKNADGTHNELRRSKGGTPEPYPEGRGAAHTQLGAKQGRKGEYRQAREFDEQGRPVKDIDFTNHGRPQNHPKPHQHRYIENETGGTLQRMSEAEPLPEHLWNYEKGTAWQ